MRIKFIPRNLYVGLYYEHVMISSPVEDGHNEFTEIKTFYSLCIIPCITICWVTTTPIRTEFGA